MPDEVRYCLEFETEEELRRSRDRSVDLWERTREAIFHAQRDCLEIVGPTRAAVAPAHAEMCGTCIHGNYIPPRQRPSQRTPLWETNYSRAVGAPGTGKRR